MADLLECLIQIKALGETLDVATRSIPAGSSPELARVTGPGVWAEMAETERRYSTALGTEAGTRISKAPASGDSPHAREAFVEQRRANLVMLEGCSAARLAGPVEWPGRPSTTVADLVAIMLANDTEVLGELRRARLDPSSRNPLATP